MKNVIEKIAVDFNLTKKLAKEVVESVVDGILDGIKTGNKLRISGLGSFSVVEKAERAGRNPATGETITIPAKKAVKFTTAKELKEAVK